LGGAPFIFFALQRKSSDYFFRNAAVAFSAPGALAGICLLGFAIFRTMVVYHDILGISALIRILLTFPAILILPIAFIVSIQQKKNGLTAKVLFSVLSMFAVVLYFWTASVAGTYPSS